MGAKRPDLTEVLIDFIGRQPVFFVATATADSRINCSPKGMDSLRVLAPDRLIWANLTGSGNETAAHCAADGRITLMWCSFAADPLILRVYGYARAVHPHDPAWDELCTALPIQPGLRQVIDVAIELVHTSCGFGVPRMDLVGERPRLREWADKKGPAGLQAYQRDKNLVSIDGLPTGLLPDQR